MKKKAERQKGSFVTNANDAIIDMKKYAKVTNRVRVRGI